MGHIISGILGKLDVLTHFSTGTRLHPPVPLIDDLAFLPLSDEHLDSLFPLQSKFDNPMVYLSQELKAALLDISSSGPVAYIETEYHGGTGTQGVVVYDQGLCRYGPTLSPAGVISRALKLMGVKVKPGQHDEFDAVGLHRHRNNEDWIEVVMPSQESD